MAKYHSGTINMIPHGLNSYIKRLIQEGEHQQLDFKFEISDSRKIAKTLVAFSNTDGGTLLIGVKDNGNIAGVHSDEEFYMVQAAAGMYCKPEIVFESKRWMVDGKTVLEVIIPKGANYPYFAQTEPNKWLAYIRVKDENILATPVHLKVWKNKTHDSGILMEYSDKVKKLLEYLEFNRPISISKFCRMAFLPKSAAGNILADLIYFGLIEVVYENNHFIYYLKSKNSAVPIRLSGAIPAGGVE
jgi:predicted HTH transcriptional regulator